MEKVEILAEQSPRLEFVYLQNGLWRFSSKVSYEESQNPIPFVMQLLGSVGSSPFKR